MLKLESLSIFFVVLCLSGSSFANNQEKPGKSVIDLRYAKYEGTALPGGVTAWRGMRFAAPPVGDLRWRAPEDPPYSKGIQKANDVSVHLCPVCKTNHAYPIP